PNPVAHLLSFGGVEGESSIPPLSVSGRPCRPGLHSGWLSKNGLKVDNHSQRMLTDTGVPKDFGIISWFMSISLCGDV
ncbi:hypothetical protein, partial [Acinetobacter baumannii]|uniref:hypothetical protein n=1 Tax=Acinetobacter baumannii TaxID=470 RepID=UPI001C087301